MSDILSNLNEAQRQAVEQIDGQVLVIAGPGTGKTHFLTHKIAYLVQQGINPRNILALTFSNKAAGEMSDRVEKLLPGARGVTISTFHSFGNEFIRKYYSYLGLAEDYKVLSPAEQVILLKENLFRDELSSIEVLRPLSNPTRYIPDIVQFISRCQDEDIKNLQLMEHVAYAQYEDRIEENRMRDLIEFYRFYRELKLEKNLIDFADQITMPLNLLRERPTILSEMKDQFKYILVDEFQDTNTSQLRLVSMLTGYDGNITVVGDDDQSIYRWRGASIKNIDEFRMVYPTAKTIVLTENYRSGQLILDCAQELIQNNTYRLANSENPVAKELVSKTDIQAEIQFDWYDNIASEVGTVCNGIESLTEEQNYQYRDIAILLRTNADAEPFMSELRKRNIPFRFSGNRGLWQQPEIRLLLSYLHVVSDPSDDLHLHKIIADTELYALRYEFTAKAVQIARKENIPLIKALSKIDDPNAKEVIDVILADMESLIRISRSQSTAVVLYEILNLTFYLKSLTETEQKQKINNIRLFFDILRDYNRIVEIDSVTNFVKYVDDLIEADDRPDMADVDTQENAVQVMTVHAAKGLEFDVVFIPMMLANKFPSKERSEAFPIPPQLLDLPESEADLHTEDERKLFFVAMTRAKEKLFLSASENIGGKMKRKVSRFVNDAGILCNETPITTAFSESIQVVTPIEEDRFGTTIIVKDNEPIKMTAHSIIDYDDCPLRYKFAHVLRLPSLKIHQALYGLSIHAATQLLNKCLIDGKEVTDDDMLQTYYRTWKREGYMCKEHAQLREAQGIKTIEYIFNRPRLITPISQERQLKVAIGGVELTVRFDCEGKDQAGKIGIVDYKSSDVEDQEKADKKLSDSLQMRIYSVAWQIENGKPADFVQLDFVDSQLIAEKTFTPKVLSNTIEKIKEIERQIREQHFPPNAGPFTCGYCPFRAICSQAV